jgi:hypothetical protein
MFNKSILAENTVKQIVHFNVLPTILNRATILATALALSLSACTRNQPPFPITLQPIAAANLPKTCSIKNAIWVEPEDLREDLDDYVGQCLSIRETVGKPVGNHAFLLIEYQLLGSKTILVFNASGTPSTVPPDRVAEAVLVAGEVDRFTISRSQIL